MKKNVTIDDIADRLNINISTVSRALKDHPNISEATKKKVLKTAKDLNYHPNNIATALVIGQSRLIGVMVPFTDENFFASAIRGIEEVAKKEGYQIVIFQSNDKKEDEIQNFKTMLATKVDGIIASHAMETKNFDHYQQILERDIPLILFDRYNQSIDTNIVSIDDFSAAYKAVEHLIEQGCKKIVHFSGYQNVHIYKERLRGYKQALQDHGITFNQKLIFEGDLTLKSGRAFTAKIIESACEIDAIFAANDYTAMGAIQELKKHDIKIPQQVAIVGFSNETFTSFVTPSITTVEQHSRKMGKIAAQSFFDLLSGDAENEISTIPDKKILNAQLIVRESSLRK